MKDICTTISFNILEIDKFGPQNSEKISRNHHAHFLINSGKEILLKVFYDESTNLADKILGWENIQDEFALGKVINFEKLNEDGLIDIDLDGSKVLTTQNDHGAGMFDPGLGKYFTVTFDRIKLHYQMKSSIDSNMAYVGLNSVAKTIINNFYFYQTFIDKERSTWKANSRYTKFSKYHDIKYRLKYVFGQEKDEGKDHTIISKHPQLLIKFGDLSIEKINNYISNFCAIMSFYINADIYSLGYSINKGKDKYQYYTINNDNISFYPFSIFSEFGNRMEIFDYVGKCKFLEGKDLLFFKKVVQRFNLASAVEGESRFMLLFELFERLRSKFSLEFEEIKTEYQFLFPEVKRLQIIENLGNSFKKIVPDSQQEELYNRFVSRVRDIRFLDVSTQYSSLLRGLNLQENFWMPEIKLALKYRNTLFHGGSINVEDDNFKNTTHKLWELVILLICKFQGFSPGKYFG